MDKLGMEEDEPIEHKLVTRSIESAQKKVEARNFAIRKQVLEYDDVMNQQREVIYAQRKKILQQANLRDTIMDMIHKVVDRTMAMYAPPEVYSEDWDLQALIAYAEEFYAPVICCRLIICKTSAVKSWKNICIKLPMNITLNARMLLHLN